MSVQSRGLLDCIPAWPLYCLHWLWCQEGQGDHLDISTPAFMLCVLSALCGEGPPLEQVSDESSLQLPASVWANPGHWTEAFIALKELKDELGRERWNGSRERAVVVLGVESEASDCISPGLQLVSCRQAASHEAAENPRGCLDPK